MPGLDELIGTTYGPFPMVATAERVAAFVGAIGDDPGQWITSVHPMFANAALFSAAPAFLEDDAVVPFTRSLIHSEQVYEWHSTPAVGSEISVSGTVESVRGRGGLHFVTFSLAADTGDSRWVTGSSVFLMSEEAAAVSEGAAEPEEDDRPPVTDALPPLPIPAEGEEVDSITCGASRTDLMRYAAATGDRNPIHFDHDAARRAGLEGVIVHGLLMAAWLGRLAGRYGSLRAMKLRFRNPLRPARAATAHGSVASVAPDSAELDLQLSAGEQRLVTARIAVTR